MVAAAGVSVRQLVCSGRAAIAAGVAVLALGWAVPGVSVAAWSQPVASPLNVDPTRSAVSPSVTSIGGVPYVAWSEFDGTANQIRVKQFTGGVWSDVGGSLNTDPTKTALSPSITGIGGVPYAAWIEFTGAVWRIRVKLFSEGAWRLVGDWPHVDPSSASAPSITSVGGVPYVAWSEFNGIVNQVRVKRFTGGAWSDIGGALNSDPSTNGLAASIATVGGVPYVAWQESNGIASQIRVKRLIGGGWTHVGGSLNVDPTRDGSGPRITNVGGVPYVTWQERNAAGDQIRVAKFTGAAWTAVGSSLNVDRHKTATAPAITSIDGAPFVAWQEVGSGHWEVRAARFAGKAWSDVGGPLNVDPISSAYTPAITRIGGVPYVAWDENDGSEDQIRVARLQPDFLNNTALATRTGAMLISKVRDYGVPLPIAFKYGKGSSLQRRTALQRTFGAGYDALATRIAGLTPNTGYSWQPFASDTFRQTAHGPTGRFTTRPGPLILIVFRAIIFPGRVTLRYALTATADLELSVKPHRGKGIVVAHTTRTMGIGKLTWNRKLRGKRARPGSYKLTMTATRNGRHVHSNTLTVKLR